jgi:hypothetical protein
MTLPFLVHLDIGEADGAEHLQISLGALSSLKGGAGISVSVTMSETIRSCSLSRTAMEAL